MSDSPFELQHHLDFLYRRGIRRSMADTQTPEEFADWQTALRRDIQQRLGLAGRESLPVAAEMLQTVDRGTYTEEKIRLDGGEGVAIPLYVLVPKRPPPFKPVLVFPGHDPSVQYCLGDYPDPETAKTNLAADNDYARSLVCCGYLVVAVEQRGLGERQAGPVQAIPPQRSCRPLAFTYLLMGRSLMGERCWDGVCAINYVLSRPGGRTGWAGLHWALGRGRNGAMACGPRPTHPGGGGLRIFQFLPGFDPIAQPLRMQLHSGYFGVGGNG